MSQDASRPQTSVHESADVTYSVGGSYYCFGLRQQEACVATSDFDRLLLSAAARSIYWQAGKRQGNCRRWPPTPVSGSTVDILTGWQEARQLHGSLVQGVETNYEDRQRSLEWVKGAKRSGREADHSPPSNAQVMNEWSFPVLPTNVFSCKGSIATSPLTGSSSCVTKASVFALAVDADVVLNSPGVLYCYSVRQVWELLNLNCFNAKKRVERRGRSDDKTEKYGEKYGGDESIRVYTVYSIILNEYTVYSIILNEYTVYSIILNEGTSCLYWSVVRPL